jgi:hypothetical protein
MAEEAFSRPKFHDSEARFSPHENPHLIYLLGDQLTKYGMNARTGIIVSPLPDLLPFRAVVSI